jgi:methylated-DNA-protein-cysteine methyltransferase related protein
MQMTADSSPSAILAALAATSPGSVLGYGELAARAGLPGRARLAARVLSQLPSGSQLPWYRVVRANHCIAFAPGSADFARQRQLLLAEGCEVSDSGRVKPARTTVRSLDQELWGDMFSVP